MATITRRNSGRWQAVVRKKGHPSKTKSFSTKTLAVQWARDQERAIEQGEVLDTRLETTRLKELLERYKEEMLPQKRGGNQAESRMALLKSALGEVLLKDLTVERLGKFLSKRLAVVGRDTALRDLADLSAVLSHATVEWGYPFKTNPVSVLIKARKRAGILRPRVERDRRLYHGEYKKLLRASSPRLRLIIRLMIETGMRRGEVARMTARDLRPDGQLIREDKTGQTTVIPISRKARRIIEKIGPNGLGIRADSITQAFERACKRAGLVDLRVHDLRHEAISRWFEKGLLIGEVQMISRHKDLRSLNTYIQHRRADVAKKLG